MLFFGIWLYYLRYKALKTYWGKEPELYLKYFPTNPHPKRVFFRLPYSEHWVKLREFVRTEFYKNEDPPGFMVGLRKKHNAVLGIAVVMTLVFFTSWLIQAVMV